MTAATVESKSGCHRKNTDSLDCGGNKSLAIGDEFHLEARINPTHFAEASAQGRAIQLSIRDIGQVLAASDKDFAVETVDHCDFVETIAGANANLPQPVQFVNLRPVTPRFLRPDIQHGARRNGLFCTQLSS